jgi:hypothetical protein
MRDMRISSAELRKRFGALFEMALTKPLTITRNGRDRRVVRLEDFTSEEIALIAKADVSRRTCVPRCRVERLTQWGILLAALPYFPMF